MHIRNLLIICLSGLMLAACSSTPDSASAKESARAASETRDVGAADTEGAEKLAASAELEIDLDRVTCKSEVRTGTRLRSRVCKTNRAWRDQQRNAREAAEHIQRRSAQVGNPDGG